MAILYGLSIPGGAGVALVGRRATPDDLDSASPLTLWKHLRTTLGTSIEEDREWREAP